MKANYTADELIQKMIDKGYFVHKNDGSGPEGNYSFDINNTPPDDEEEILKKFFHYAKSKTITRTVNRVNEI